jgi:hypothetical protein
VLTLAPAAQLTAARTAPRIRPPCRIESPCQNW